MKAIARPGATDYALLALTALIWGTAFPAIKISVVELGALWTAAGRVAIGFLALLPVFLFNRESIPVGLERWRIIVMVSILNLVAPFILINWALTHIEAGTGALLLGATPIIALVLGHFFTRDERINGLRIVAVLLAFCGLALVVGMDAVEGIRSNRLLAQLAIVASGACYVTAGLLMRRMDLNPVAFTTTAMGSGVIILLAASFAVAGAPSLDLSSGTWTALIWLGLFPSGLAYLMRYFLMRRVGISTFSLAMNTVPVFGIITSALLLGEAITAVMLVSLILIMSGLAVARYATSAESGESK